MKQRRWLMKRLMVIAGASALLASSVLFASLPARDARAAEPSAASRASLEATPGRYPQPGLCLGPGRPPAAGSARARPPRLHLRDLRSSAWIPQSLFEGNVVTQAVIGDVDTIVREKNRARPVAREHSGQSLRDGAPASRPPMHLTSRSRGRSTACCVTPRRSTAAPTSARGPRSSTRRCSATRSNSSPTRAGG